MIEQPLPTRERTGPGPGLGSLFDEPDPDLNLVRVESGPYREQLPVGNMTVGEIRARFRDRLDLDPHSTAVLDGRDVRDDAIVRPGQVLAFSHRSGEKGTESRQARCRF